MIHTLTAITPYCLDKNFGKMLNDRIETEQGEWVLLTDADACFLTPRYGEQLIEICNTTQFDLLGCVTNRLGRTIQRDKEALSHDWDMRNHYKRAYEREWDYWGQVEDITKRKYVAGLCMLFRKSLWEQIKFKENCITWDDEFSLRVVQSGGKLGLMTGVYMFHSYRPWADFPIFSNQHLVNK